MDKPLHEQFPHYFVEVPEGTTHIDIYWLLNAFKVADPCVQHAVKKLFAAGRRGAKDTSKDINEAIISLRRWQELHPDQRAPSAKNLNPIQWNRDSPCRYTLKRISDGLWLGEIVFSQASWFASHLDDLGQVKSNVAAFPSVEKTMNFVEDKVSCYGGI